jgi:hypothetical protein
MAGKLAAAVLTALFVASFPSVGSGSPAGSGSSRISAAPSTSTLVDLDNHPLDPFRASEGSRAIVFLFASVDCPISNRYAPTVKRLHASFAPQGVAFWLVYPNPAETPDAIREHVKAFDYPVHVVRDPKHELVKVAQASVTPEAAVYDATGTLVYHGRIDNRYVSLGVERPAATEHDLEDVLTAVAAGKPVRETSAPAVGCFIVDFVE